MQNKKTQAAKANTIYRVNKDKENPYVMLNKLFLSDNKLSWKAKGILSYLLSKPDNWEVRIGDLIKQSTDGRDAIYSGLKELENAGYIVRQTIRNENGQFSQLIYNVFEKPIEKSKSVDLSDTKPFTENPETVKADTEKAEHNNNKDIIINNINNKSVNQSGTTDEQIDNNIKFILQNAKIYDFTPDAQDLITNIVTDIYYNSIDDLPVKMVRSTLHKINYNILQSTILKFSYAQEETEIKNPLNYMKKTLWNTILEAIINKTFET